MEIATKYLDISPSRPRTGAAIFPGETGGAGFRTALAKAASLAGAQQSHQGVRQTGVTVASGNNKFAAFNAFDGFSQKKSAPSSPGSGDSFATPAFHTVKPGETLYGIARKNLAAQGLNATPKDVMTSIRSLSEYNGIKDQNRIYPGQKIDLTVLNPHREKLLGLPMTPLPLPQLPGGDSAKGPALLEEDKKTITLSALHADPVALGPDQARLLTASEYFSNGQEDMAADAKQQNVFANQFDPQLLATVSAKTSSQPSLVTEKGLAVDGLKPIVPGSDAGNLMVSSTASSQSSDLSDFIYKGALGKALDFLPMQAEDRVVVQQAGSVVNGALTGIKLSGLLNIATPIAAVFGLLWGAFSAKNIETAETRNKQE